MKIHIRRIGVVAGRSQRTHYAGTELIFDYCPEVVAMIKKIPARHRHYDSAHKRWEADECAELTRFLSEATVAGHEIVWWPDMIIRSINNI